MKTETCLSLEHDNVIKGWS